MIVAGIGIFSLSDLSRESLDDIPEPHYKPLGYLLILFNLGFDGLTCAFQDKIKQKKPRAAAQKLFFSTVMMFWINVWSTLFHFFFLFIASKEGNKAISFLYRHPEARTDILVMGILGAVGQIFIFNLITLFGSLACSTVTTTRKFFQILLSVVIHETKLSMSQWIGVFLVFASLAWNVVSEYLHGTTGDADLSESKRDSLSPVSSSDVVIDRKRD